MNEVVIRVEGVGKTYRIWRDPSARLRSIFLHALKHVVRPLWGRCTAAQATLFRDFHALRGVTLDIKRGEAVGIIGRNGSGKSTLLQIIAGTLAPTAGVVETHGRVAALLELGSGFNPEFTGRENVRLNASILGLSEKEIDERFDDIAAFADIGDFIEQPVKTYSSGMMMRLAFAVQTHVFADIIIVDEALAVGDIRFVQKCMRRLRELLDRGTTLLFVTHEPATVRSLCNRAIWIDAGEVRQIADPVDVTRNYAQFMAYGESSMNLAMPAAPHAPSAALAADLQTVDPPPESALGAITRFGAMNLDTSAPCVVMQGGESILLTIEVVARARLERPNVCIHLNDRLEQTLVGWNAHFFGSEIGPMEAGQRSLVQFTSEFPLLLAGNYSLSLGFADGTREHHVPLHIVHAFWPFKVIANEPQQRNYLFGVRNVKVSIERWE
jgi:lipopolysaccharide transport system ATP-binding protein